MKTLHRICGFCLAAIVAGACSAQSPERVDAPSKEERGTVTSGLAPNCSQSGFTVTCTYLSGTSSTFTVPKGVSSIRVLARGGTGGTGFGGAVGGHGAVIIADLDVSAIPTLYVNVGGNGGDGFGGANGGGGANPGNGGGGGASDVRTGPDLASRLLVAAGGGGGATRGHHDEPPGPAAGGAGGDPGVNGGNGEDADSADGGGWVTRAGHGGHAGGSASPGGGGAGGTLYCAFLNECDDPNLGCTGSAAIDAGGGTGGFRATDQCTAGGGGGGGGRFGGGGGGGGDAKYGIAGAGGGGGGSNLVPPGGTVSLDATGVPQILFSYTAPIVVSPTSLSFGDQAIGSTSASKTATLTVSGTAAIGIASVTIDGSNAGDFAIAGDTCSGKSVATDESCTVQVTFSPTVAGARSATLAFHDDATDTPQVVTISGNGTTAADVGVTITGPATAKNNSQNSYVVRVANAGPSQALGVTMTASVPPGTKFAGVQSTKGTCTSPSIGATTGTITCSLGTLDKDAAALETVTLRFAMNGKGGTIALTAQASASTSDPSLGNNVASINTSVGK